MGTNTLTENNRDTFWDALKWILMFFVIYGHLLPRFYEESRINMALFNLIYMFHMPLFIFISGRFSHNHNKKKFKSGIIRLLETYVVFQIILEIVSAVVGGGKSLLISIITPNWALWYIVSLIFWRIIVLFIPNYWLEHRGAIILSSIIISLLSGFIPIGDTFALQRTMAYLPFFMLGYYSIDLDIRNIINKIPKLVSTISFLLLFFILYYFYNYSLSFMHHCCYPYWDDSIKLTLNHLFQRFIFLIIGSIFGLMFMRLAPIVKIFAQWGRKTMFIFIYHMFVLYLFFALFSYNFLPSNTIFLLVYSIIIIIGLSCLSKIRFMNILLNPVSFIVNLINKEYQ